MPKTFTTDDVTYMYVDLLKWTCKSGLTDCSSNVETMKALFEKAFYPKGMPTPKNGSIVKNLDISVDSLVTPKTMLKSDESYTVTTSVSGVKVTANNLYGVSRALATVAQLIVERPGDEYKPGHYSMQSIRISDKPAFEYRALMLDTSRHFLPVSTIKRQINGMAMAKLNVLHLHVIDTQSSGYVPSLKPADQFEKAAFYNGQWYRHYNDQMKEISLYAHNLGVHMVVEFDMPGHATSWGKANPNIIANCPKLGNTSVDPTNSETFVYIKAYMQDLIDSTYTHIGKEPMIHLGGDEVDHACWLADSKIKSYMDQNNLTTSKLWQEFHKKIVTMVTEMNPQATRLYWQESFENKNDMQNGVVHAWYDQEVVISAVKQGLRVVRSAGWYLDQNQPGPESRYAFQDTWQDFYAVKADEFVDSQNKHLALGGGACMWGEKVANGNIDEFIWPRTIAVSEALWYAPGDRTITPALKDRMNEAVCKYLDIGIMSGAFKPGKPCPGHDDIRM